MHGSQNQHQSHLSATYRGLSPGNRPPSHTEVVPVATEFLSFLWGSREFVIIPSTLQDPEKYLTAVRTHKPSKVSENLGRKSWLPHFRLGNHFLGGRCWVHCHILEVWASFLNTDRVQTSGTKGKRNQKKGASEMKSKIFMPCWFEHIFSSNAPSL